MARSHKPMVKFEDTLRFLRRPPVIPDWIPDWRCPDWLHQGRHQMRSRLAPSTADLWPLLGVEELKSSCFQVEEYIQVQVEAIADRVVEITRQATKENLEGTLKDFVDEKHYAECLLAEDTVASLQDLRILSQLLGYRHRC